MKMMPGQEPYTEKELETLFRLVGSAAQAIEMFTEDELEEYAAEQEKLNAKTL